MEIYYIGYLIGYHFKNPILLCVDTEVYAVRYYLENIRGLKKDQYEIRMVTLTEDVAIELYEDYMLIEYSKKYRYITSRDEDQLTKELTAYTESIDSMYRQLIQYSEILKASKKLANDADTIYAASQIIDKHLSSAESIKSLCKKYIERSSIMSTNILEYLSTMQYIQEDRELTNLFYRKLEDNTQ